MATVNRAFFSWSGPGSFPPGGSHNWFMVGFKYGDSLSVTAHPVTGDTTALHRVLTVENIRVDGISHWFDIPLHGEERGRLFDARLWRWYQLHLRVMGGRDEDLYAIRCRWKNSCDCHGRGAR